MPSVPLWRVLHLIYSDGESVGHHFRLLAPNTKYFQCGVIVWTLATIKLHN